MLLRPLYFILRCLGFILVTGGVQLVGKYDKPGKKCLQSDLKPGLGEEDMASWLKCVSKAESRIKTEFRFGKQSE